MRTASLLLVLLLAGCLGAGDDPVEEPGLASADDGHTAAPSADPTPAGAQPVAGPDAPGNQSQAPGPSVKPSPPPPIHWEGNRGLVAVPAFGPWPECDAPLTGCDGPAFTLDATFDVEATLTWLVPSTDLDLVLALQTDGTSTEISRDGDNGVTEPATRQVLVHRGLPAGHYRLWIAPQHGVTTDYVLDVTFR